jgi:DNA-binding NtrC family response regulator
MNTEPAKPVVLIVDDDKNTRDGLARALKRKYEVLLAESAETAVAILADSQVEVLLSDIRMPGMDGLQLLQRAMAHQPTLICILLTAYGNVETAVEAMKRGAYDFLMKPVNLDHLELLLDRAIRSRDMEKENVHLREQLDSKFGMEPIIGNSPPMQQVFDMIRQVAPTQATVLIQGESGTGKELVAQAIHRLSTRVKGPFVAVHCAALPANLLESELFGHEKGAFTGALARRKGRFEMADGGTLLLDEISEIDLSVQVKLLRVLEERKFERVGGAETVDVDIRLLAATNRNLKEYVAQNKFREDLFFRLNVVDITVPPLRDRKSDVPLLCDHFLKEFCRANGKNIDGFTPDAIGVLSDYDWPGNVRELRNTIEKMVVLSRGDKIVLRDVPAAVRDPGRSGVRSAREPASEPGGDADSLAGAERRMIIAAIRKNDGNRTRAARELGISRRTLHRKLNQYREENALPDDIDADEEP